MKKLLFTVIATLLYACVAFSQVNPNSFEFAMLYISTGEVRPHGNPLDPKTGSLVDTIYERVCKVNVADTTLIAQILLDVGTNKDSSDVFSYSFVWDNTLNLPEGTSYFREGNQLYLGLFETIMTDMYHYKMQIRDINGIISDAKYFY